MQQPGSGDRSHAHLTDVLREIGVEPIIHAGGTKSSMGGSVVPHEVADLMRVALDVFVPVEELLNGAGDAAGRLIGVESAAVVAGAASGCVLSAVALANMARQRRHVPGTPVLVTQRRHYGRYTYLYEQAGCKIREVGTMNDCPESEYERAVDESVVGFAWLEGPGIRSAGVSLEELCSIAHGVGLPVLVDAAAMAFPLDNVHRYLQAGSDLVVVSGGKLVQGPQNSGFVFGRADLVKEIRRVSFPHQGAGRAHKITKESVLGAYAALRRFVDSDPNVLLGEVRARAERSCQALVSGGVAAEVRHDSRHTLPAVVLARVAELTGRAPSGWSAVLLAGSPRIFLPFDDALDELRIEFASLRADDDDRVTKQILTVIGAATSDARHPGWTPSEEVPR